MCTLEHLSDLKADLRKEINDTVNEIKGLIPNTHIMAHRSRKVRDPFDFTGRFSKSAFGTATVKDLKILQKHMIQMVQQQNDLSDAFQNQIQLMTSFAGTVDHRFNDAVNGIANNHLLIAEMVKKWDTSYSITDKVLSTTTSMLIQEIRAYTKVHMRILKLSQGVNGLLTYKLSPNLIDPKTLNYTLYTISATQKFPQFHIATFDHHYYYKTTNIVFAHNGNNLFATLSIPITSGSKLFNVYQIISLPAPLNQSTNNATQLTNFPPYFAIDQTRNTFLEINTIQKETCVGDHKWHCPQFLPQKAVSDVSCISAIFAQNTQVVPKSATSLL